MPVAPIETNLDELCHQLKEGSAGLRDAPEWPESQLQVLREAGVFRWFIPKAYGGWEWSESEVLAGYLALSQSCLTTTFILTQWNAACKRVLGSSNEALKSDLLPKMAEGTRFATVGISHLTTSRQHVAPVLTAEYSDGDFLLRGFSPWVTAGPAADVLVVGATLQDATQVLLAVDAKSEGVRPSQGTSLVALSASCTGEVRFEDVRVPAAQVVAGPIENVMATNSGGGAGGLQTSMLAVGLSKAAASFLREQAMTRPNLVPIASKMRGDVDELTAVLVALTDGDDSQGSAAELRQRANSLVLRSTQAALSAAKGAGFVASHPAGRWAKEALFFLVWSCPQSIVDANLCELAQIPS